MYSNIRTPKVLMDLSADAGHPAERHAAAPRTADEGSTPARPLEQEPLLAARIMVEDCIDLLMDVDDIDRLLASRGWGTGGAGGGVAGTGRPEPPQLLLRQRRALLLVGIASSFRLPNTPSASASSSAVAGGEAAAALGDGVFFRIMALTKGRSLLARTLKLIDTAAGPDGSSGGSSGAPVANSHAGAEEPGPDEGAPPGDHSSPLHLVWAAMRGALRLFNLAGPGQPGTAASLQLGPSTAPPASSSDATAAGNERSMVEATSHVAAGLRDLAKRFTQPRQALDCLDAFVAGARRQQAEAAAVAGPLASLMDTAILPLAHTRQFHPGAGAGAGTPAPSDVWLGEALASLLQCAEQLGCAAAAPTRWSEMLDELLALVTRHLEALLPLHSAAVAGGNAEFAGRVMRLTSKPLMQVLVALAQDQRRAQLRDLLLQFLA